MLANVFDITSCFRLSPPWGGRLAATSDNADNSGISIHALRGEGDRTSSFTHARNDSDFNPRPPWGGRR